MLSENIHRSDPNVYDQTSAIVELIAIAWGKSQEETIRVLYRLRNYDSNLLKGDLTDDEKSLREIAGDTIKKLNTQTITLSTLLNRLQVLQIDHRLKEPIRKRQLGYSIALALNKIRDSKEFEALLKRTIEEKLSKRVVEDLVNEIKQTAAEEKKPEDEDQKFIKSTVKMFNTKTIRNLHGDKLARARKLADELKKLIEEE